jgi:hypothetical protein
LPAIQILDEEWKQDTSSGKDKDDQPWDIEGKTLDVPDNLSLFFFGPFLPSIVLLEEKREKPLYGSKFTDDEMFVDGNQLFYRKWAHYIPTKMLKSYGFSSECL